MLITPLYYVSCARRKLLWRVHVCACLCMLSPGDLPAVLRNNTEKHILAPWMGRTPRPLYGLHTVIVVADCRPASTQSPTNCCLVPKLCRGFYSPSTSFHIYKPLFIRLQASQGGERARDPSAGRGLTAANRSRGPAGGREGWGSTLWDSLELSRPETPWQHTTFFKILYFFPITIQSP